MDDRLGHTERRGDPRITAEYIVHLMVSLHGFDADDHRFTAKGVTINISHRGTLVRVDRAVPEGSRCLVHLPDGEEHLGKSLIYGTVVRTCEIKGTFEIAIEFDTRLQAMTLGDTLN
jgi:hypothetical protein